MPLPTERLAHAAFSSGRPSPEQIAWARAEIDRRGDRERFDKVIAEAERAMNGPALRDEERAA